MFISDSSEVDDEEYGLNVSSDEDCENESVGDSEEKKDVAGLFRAEESRDLSYIVEVLTEAGISIGACLQTFQHGTLQNVLLALLSSKSWKKNLASSNFGRDLKGNFSLIALT